MARPKKVDKLENVGTRLPVDMVNEISSIATSVDRSNGWLLRKLVTRGLMAYKRDGLLDEPEMSQAAPQKIVLSDGRVLEGPFVFEINGIKFDRLSDEVLQELSKTLPLKET